MSQPKTMTFIEALDAMPPLKCPELGGATVARDDVALLLGHSQTIVWKLANESHPEMRRQLYMMLAQINRALGVPTLAPEVMLGEHAVAEGYEASVSKEGGAA
jgi:hypothetical protein